MFCSDRMVVEIILFDYYTVSCSSEFSEKILFKYERTQTKHAIKKMRQLDMNIYVSCSISTNPLHNVRLANEVNLRVKKNILKYRSTVDIS